MPDSPNALVALAGTAIGLYLIMVILRFLFQLLRVDFRNPLAQVIVSLTNLPLRFLRRFIPGLYGIDLASVVLIVILGLGKLTLPLLLGGYQFRWGGALVWSVADSADTLIWVLLLAVLARVVLSWVAPHSQHPAAQLVQDLSEPIMAPFRRILPPMAGLDLSPVLTLLTLNLTQKWILLPLMNFGASLL